MQLWAQGWVASLCPPPPSSSCAYSRINAPTVQAAGNTPQIKVNVNGIHMRSKGQEIENNPTPGSRGPSV